MTYINLGKKRTQKNKDDIKRKERLAVYQSKRWLDLRKVKLMNSPLCEIHLKIGEIVEAEDVHHIDSFMKYEGLERTEKAYDYNNLMSICKECHGKLHSGLSVDDILKEIKEKFKKS